MIRGPDIASTAQWARQSLTPASTANTRDAASWFDAGTGAAEPTIHADLSAASRGLTVQQHADRVLMHLRDEADPRA